MSLELKIKSKHLGLEAGVIRHEERKLTKQIEWLKNHQQNGAAEVLIWKRKQIADHRKWDVRNENRATFLARAFIANVPYALIEKQRKPEKECAFWNSIVQRIVSMVVKYDKRYDPNDREKALKAINVWLGHEEKNKYIK